MPILASGLSSDLAHFTFGAAIHERDRVDRNPSAGIQLGDVADDHPDVEELYARATAIDNGISIATVYRTVKLFEEAGILERLDFRDGRARYEDADRDHHDHLIDMNSGEVIEFVDEEIEALQDKIAQKLGYRLVGHKLELYGVPLKKG